MALSVLLVLGLGVQLVLQRWRCLAWMLYAAITFLFLAVSCGPIPAWLLGALQSPYLIRPSIEWGKRNAIVLFGAGTERIEHMGSAEPGTFSYARIVAAASLYRSCRQTGAICVIIASGGDPMQNGSPEAAVYRDVLARLGVDFDDILLEAGSMNTWQNAQFTSAKLGQYGADQVLLVSSGFQLQRSALYFAHFGVRAVPVRADYLRAIPSLLPLSYNLAVTDTALHEYIGIARYHIYNALGWNSSRKVPGEA